MGAAKKTFVLDTNVILHDSSCIYQFQENDILIPITVIEELDHFKKGSSSLNFHAREFVRALDALSGDELFDGGVRIGPGLGKIRLRLEQVLHVDLMPYFSRKEPDHAILNTAYHCAKQHPGTIVTLVSKDVNLRMKAKAIGLQAEDYTTDRVSDISELYTGSRMIDAVLPEIIDELYGAAGAVPRDRFAEGDTFVPNEFLILKTPDKSALAMFDPFSRSVRRVQKNSAYGIMPRNAEQTFALHALESADVQLVTLTGKAGTGKTLLALAAALEARSFYRQIYLARPIVPLSNKDIGYLPGDIQSKLNPYMQPLHDNLGVIRDQFSEKSPNFMKINQLLEEEKLKIEPLSYIRGRSLVKVCFIVDEAQNLTPHEVKTIITRAGEGTKVVFTGDIFQIDHPYLDKHSNGLTYLIEKMRGQNIYAHVNLVKGERSQLAELASNLL